MNKIWVVTAVDVGDSCDGKARVLGAFKNEKDARAYVKSDMEYQRSLLANTDIQVDFDQMSITNEDEDVVCLWNVESVEVQG